MHGHRGCGLANRQESAWVDARDVRAPSQEDPGPDSSPTVLGEQVAGARKATESLAPPAACRPRPAGRADARIFLKLNPTQALRASDPHPADSRSDSLHALSSCAIPFALRPARNEAVSSQIRCEDPIMRLTEAQESTA